MRVALNLGFLAPGAQGGLETYSRELVRALAGRPDVELLLLLNRLLEREPEWGDYGECVVLPVDPRRRLEWVLADQHHAPRAAERAGAEILHSLASVGPARGRTVRVTTVHDLNYKLVPDTHFGMRGFGMRVLVPLAVRRSRRVLVDAEATRADLVRYLGAHPGKVDVAPLAARVPSGRGATPERELRDRLGLGGRRLVLSPSAKRPHKNLPALIRALAGLAPAGRPTLVVPGYPTPHESELRRLAAQLGVSELVSLLPWIRAEELEGLYRAATCVVFPSLYEGFGLPILEAMARGVPVACSDIPVLREVAGAAALLFDPADVGAIRDAMGRLLGDLALRERLGALGRERAAAFTWERTAQLTVACYERALATRPA